MDFAWVAPWYLLILRKAKRVPMVQSVLPTNKNGACLLPRVNKMIMAIKLTTSWRITSVRMACFAESIDFMRAIVAYLGSVSTFDLFELESEYCILSQAPSGLARSPVAATNHQYINTKE